MIFIQQLPSLFQQHKSIKQLNLQALTIWVNKQKFIIVPNLSRSRIPTILQIDRKSKEILEHQSLPQQTYKTYKPYYFSCLIGIMNLNEKKIIILAEEVLIVGSIGQRDIFHITKPIYLFYDSQEKKNLNDKEAEILLNVTAIFEQGMYFSFSYDLSLRMNTSNSDDNDKAQFNWAHNLQKQLHQFDETWRVSVIQGFVGRIELHINGLKLFYVLISRRKVKRGGTHSYARGIDNEGNAGNFVQTQQILIIGDHYFSFLQCRGMVPIYWNQSRSNYGFSSVQFYNTISQNRQGLIKHCNQIQKRGDFNVVLLLNVLSSSKEQKKLIENYQYLIRILSNQNTIKKQYDYDLKYAYFDIHTNCPNKQYKKLAHFLQNQLKDAISFCNFTALRKDKVQKKIEILNHQNGIIRTNCFNCIDRTNITQSRIAALKLMEILNYLEIQISQFKDGLGFLRNDTPFSNLYRNLWADNGDALSKQYTGTGSTQSFAVRKGKLSYLTTLDHGLKSIFRVIRNIRNEDYKKQEAIRFIIGEQYEQIHSQIPSQHMEAVQLQLLKQQSKN